MGNIVIHIPKLVPVSRNDQRCTRVVWTLYENTAKLCLLQLKLISPDKGAVQSSIHFHVLLQLGSCCMHCKLSSHNGVVILNAPPQFVDHYKGGEPGQQPVKWNLLSIFWRGSQAEQTVCYVDLLRLMMGETSPCLPKLSPETRGWKRFNFFFFFRLDPFQRTVKARQGKAHLALPFSIMSSVLLQKIICIWTLRDPLNADHNGVQVTVKRTSSGITWRDLKRERLGPSF